MSKRPTKQSAKVSEPWMSKDDVARQVHRSNSSFRLLDSDCSVGANWVLGDEVDAPPVPNWKVLLHEDVYLMEQESQDAIKRKYLGFFPLKEDVKGQ